MATWPERRSNEHHSEMSLLELDRERLIARLRTDCAEGRISLDRFSDLVGDAYAAETRAELAPIVAAVAPVTPPPVAREPERARSLPRMSQRWVVSIFGSSIRKGRHRMEDGTVIAAVFGDCVIDLTAASFDQQHVTFQAFSVFGTVTVVVPPGIRVIVEGASIFGTRTCDVDDEYVTPSDQVITLRAVAVFGDVRVRSPRPSRKRGR